MNPGGNNSFSDPMVAWFADEPFRFASSFRVKSSEQAEAANQMRLNDGAEPGSISFNYAEHYASTPHGEIFEVDIPLMQPRVGERFEGEVYVLVDRMSYSNAVTTAALIQDYGFGTIIGEKTSDFATTYGAMEKFSLLKTGIEVGFPKAHIVRPSGDMTPDGVTPDTIVERPLVPGKTDSVLEMAMQLISSRAD